MIATGLFLVIFFLYSILKSSLFLSLNEQINKISMKFMFFYTLNIIMLKILINSFKREFELKNSISYLYLYLQVYISDFSYVNSQYLTLMYKNSVNYFLMKVIFYNYDVKRQFYLLAESHMVSDLNKFILILERVLSTKALSLSSK